MTWLEAVAVVLAGMAAGGVNAVIGSGSLVTVPTLLAVGLPPVTANVSNNIGLVPGSISGAWWYHRELEGQGRRARTLAVTSGLGGLTSSILLSMLAVLVPDDLKRSNALKNVLAGTVNAVAAIVFVAFADVRWDAVALVAAGAIIGGALGARIGRRVPPIVLRTLVVMLGVVVAIRLVVT